MGIKYFIKELTHLSSIRSEVGWGNGYVCIPKNHPWYELDYDSIPVSVHGGLTYAIHSSEINWIELPEECKQDYWVIGFDCAHYGDNPFTCPKEYVESEAKRLAQQAEDASNVCNKEVKL